MSAVSQVEAGWIFNISSWTKFFVAIERYDCKFSVEMMPNECDQLLRARIAARARGEYEWADAIRDDLAFYGLTIRDRADGRVEVRR